jgi:methylenetetrahydrofolate dehydrogenase (NADP+)/methenyltetrahydrofolate cyclohydrolase
MRLAIVKSILPGGTAAAMLLASAASLSQAPSGGLKLETERGVDVTTVLRGIEVAEALNEQTSQSVAELREKGVLPQLAILRMGEREDNLSYVRGAMRRAEKVGVAVRQVVLPQDASQELLIQSIEELNADSSVHGILTLRPFPHHIDEQKVRNVVAVHKDVDGVGDQSLAGVLAGIATGYAPCTAESCMRILSHFAIPLSGKNVVVIGRSLVVGRPVALMLLAQDATVTVCHSQTVDLPAVVRQAEIVIVCVGRAHLLDARYLRAGQVVIDVGTNMTEGGQLVGDVDFAAADGLVKAITPVPGGVGTVTTSVLMHHVAQAAQHTLI